jgi:hypothetical protein
MNAMQRTGEILAAVLMFALVGCGAPNTTDSVPSVEEAPLTAQQIADRYGPITGEVALVLESSDLQILLSSAEIRTWQTGRAPEQATVTEYLVRGQPYKIVVKGKRGVDPLSRFSDDEIDYIEYGADKKGLSEPGLGAMKIDEPAELRRIIAVLRNRSRQEYEETAYRAYRTTGGYSVVGVEVRGRSVGGHWQGFWGLCFHLKSGQAFYARKDSPSDAFEASGMTPAFVNEELLELLKQIRAKADRKLTQ